MLNSKQSHGWSYPLYNQCKTWSFLCMYWERAFQSCPKCILFKRLCESVEHSRTKWPQNWKEKKYIVPSSPDRREKHVLWIQSEACHMVQLPKRSLSLSNTKCSLNSGELPSALDSHEVTGHLGWINIWCVQKVNFAWKTNGVDCSNPFKFCLF